MDYIAAHPIYSHFYDFHPATTQLTFRHVFDLLVILDLFDDGLHALEALILERPDDAFGVFLVIAEDEGRGLCTTLLLLLLLLRIRARSGFHL